MKKASDLIELKMVFFNGSSAYEGGWTTRARDSIEIELLITFSTKDKRVDMVFSIEEEGNEVLCKKEESGDIVLSTREEGDDIGETNQISK